MSEMVERVAKAMYERKCAKISADVAAPYRGPFTPFEDLLKAKAAYLDDARAFIAAMREPSDAVCNALARHYHDNWREGHEREDTNCEDIWRDGIDAILAEKPAKY